jgi:tetratricopeptide (TPR) repeat protein
MALEALDLIVSALIQLKLPKEAIEFQVLKVALLEDESPREIYSGVVNLASRAKDWKTANLYLSKVEKLTEKDSPELLETYRLKAILKNKEKMYKEAVEIYSILETYSLKLDRTQLAASSNLSKAQIYNLYLSDSKKAEASYKKALDQYENAKNPRGIVGASISYAAYLVKRGKFSAAIDLLMGVENLIEKVELKSRVLFYQTIANAKFQLGLFDDVYKTLNLVSKKIAQIGNVEVRQSLSYASKNLFSLVEMEAKGISAVYRELSKPIDYEQIENEDLKSVILSNRAYLQRMIGSNDNSIRSLLRSIRISSVSSNDSALASDYRNLGLAYLGLGKQKEAQRYLSDSNKISMNLGLEYNRAWTLLGLAEIKIHQKRYKEAKDLIRSGASLIEKMKSPRIVLIKEFLNYLSDRGVRGAAKLSDINSLLKHLGSNGILYNFDSGESGLFVDYTVKDIAEYLLKDLKSIKSSKDQSVRLISRLISFRESLSSIQPWDLTPQMKVRVDKIRSGKLKMISPTSLSGSSDYYHFFAGRETIRVLKISEKSSEILDLDTSKNSVLKTNGLLKSLVDLLATTELVVEDLFNMLVEPISQGFDKGRITKINPGLDLLAIPFKKLFNSNSKTRKLKLKLGNSWSNEEARKKSASFKTIIGKSTDNDLLDSESTFIKNSVGATYQNGARLHIAAHGSYDHRGSMLQMQTESVRFKDLIDSHSREDQITYSACDESISGAEFLKTLVYRKSLFGSARVIGNRNSPSSRSSLDFFSTLYGIDGSPYKNYLNAEKVLSNSNDYVTRSADFTYYYVHSLVSRF